MALFGGKHYSNPAVGRQHARMDGDGASEKGLEHGGADGGKMHHSMHVFHHDDGTAHTHIHHADGSHEHTDHATHEEANDHLKAAMDGQMPGQEEEAGEPEHMTMHNAARMGGGAY